MTASAVAACMAPLLLRPLLAGECGLEDEAEVSPDNAAQLLATLLEEYDHIFEVRLFIFFKCSLVFSDFYESYLIKL
jgi:hypothetical protein